MTIHVIITTCDRPVLLGRLLDDLDRESRKASVGLSLHILDDGLYPASVPLPPIEEPVISRFHGEPRGKRGYWQTVSLALEHARCELLSEEPWSRLLFLQDDVRLVEGFFTKVERLWRAIPDETKSTLWLLKDQRTGKACWTGQEVRRLQFNGQAVYRQQWVDCAAFWADRTFGDALAWRLRPIDPKLWRQGMVSSGVGRQMSHRLHAAGRSLYGASQALALHGDHESVMHPEHRKLTPLVSI